MNQNKTLTTEIIEKMNYYISDTHFGHSNVIMFDNVSRVKQLEGSFTDMMSQIMKSTIAWGSTNFQSVIDEIVRVRRNNPEIPLEDFPQTLIVVIVSDMQFNAVGGNTETNEEAMKRKLREVFPEEFVNSMKFIWWNVAGRCNDVPATMESSGSYLFSGFDGSIVNLLLGVEAQTNEDGTKKVAPSMEEMVSTALSQEILLQVNA